MPGESVATCCSVILITITLSPKAHGTRVHEYRYTRSVPMRLCTSLCSCACQPHCTHALMIHCVCPMQHARMYVPGDGIWGPYPNAPPATPVRHKQAALARLWHALIPSHNRIPPCRGSMAWSPRDWILHPSSIDKGDSQN